MSNVIDAFIQAIAAEVVSAAVKEFNFAANCSKEFGRMKIGLEKMKGLLSDSKLPKDKRASVKPCLSELRDIIYEADDALTDFLVRKYQIQYWRKHRCRYFLFLLFDDPLFANRMGKQLVEINMKMEKIEPVLVQHLGNNTAAPPAGSSHDGIHDPYMESRLSQDSPPKVTYGLEKDVEKLKGWILESGSLGKLERIGIVGMGGLGKTTLAQTLYNDDKVLNKFDKHIWVCVSQNFNEQRIMKRMLGKVGRTVSDFEVTSMSSILEGVLKDESYLIVMDDVWRTISLHWWSEFCSNLPKPAGKHSCIIVTTRHEDVATSMNLTQTHQHQRLSKPDSWDLFSDSAFTQYKGSKCPNDQLKEVGKEILNKCGGLPLAIKTVGRSLATKKSESQWIDTRDRFHEIITDRDNKETEEVMLSLQLSYDELPTHLKQCLLCISIYPEDFEIDAQQLIHWWIGEGLVYDKGSKTALEMGYEYLAELVSRCLVEDGNSRGYDGRVYKCKIHDMVRQLITNIAQDETFCSFDEQGRHIQKGEYRWLCLSTDNEIMAPKKNVSNNQEQPEPFIESDSKLRALLLMSSPPNDFGRDFELMQSLRVLDFSYSKLDLVMSNVINSTTTASPSEELFRWISCLKRLACLNLSGVLELEEIPSSIRKLLNLRILVLNGCNDLKRIHPAITRLKRLIVLDCGACPLENLPRGLGGLSNLQELSGFKVASRANTQGCTLVEIGRLEQLRVLRITITDSATEISIPEMKSLFNLKKLKVLAIDAHGCKEKTLKMIDGLKLPENLKELYLRNYLSSTMPNWFSPATFQNLRYLCVESCSIECLTEYKTWVIEGLCLKELNRLKADWEGFIVDMPQLCFAEIRKCSQLQNLPDSIVQTGFWRK